MLCLTHIKVKCSENVTTQASSVRQKILARITGTDQDSKHVPPK